MHPQPLLETLGHDHHLGEEGIGQLHVEWQVKADRAAADVGAPVVDVLVLRQRFLETGGERFGGEDRGVLAQRQIDHQFGPVRRGKELFGHETHQVDRCAERQDGHGNGQPLGLHRAREQRRVAAHQCPGLFRLAAALRRLEDGHADHRREGHGDQPGDDQRNADHREDVIGILAGGAGGETDGHEAGDGDQGAGQHRRSQVLVGEGGGLLLAVTGGEAADERIDGGHRVVNQQAQRNDQRAQRDALQVDAIDQHDSHDDGQGQRDGQRHHRSRAQPQADEAGSQDDQDRLPQRGGEIVDGEVDGDGLVGDQEGLDADRQLRANAGHLGFQVRAQRENVAALTHGDGQPDRRLAVDVEQRQRRVGIAAPDRGDIAQRHQPVAHSQVDGLDVGLGFEGAGDAQENALIAGLQHAGRAHQVLRLQLRQQRLVAQPQAGQPSGGKFEKYVLVLGAEYLDLGDVRHQQQLRAHILDVVAQLAMCEAIGRKAVDHAKGVTEIVVETRPDHALRQGAADIADVLAHLVPDVGHDFRGRRFLEVDKYCRDAGRGVAADAVEVAGFLQLAFDALGHLQQGLLHGRPWPGREDDHGAEGERRVLGAAQLQEGDGSGQHGRNHEVDDQRPPPDRPLRQVRPDH